MWQKEKLENLALSAKLRAFRDGLSPQLQYPDKDDFKDPRIIRFTYETCDFEPDDKTREFILSHADFNDYANVFGGIDFGELYYQDPEIWYSKTKILDSVTHEYYMAVYFTDELKEKFIAFEGETLRNREILNTLERSYAPELAGLTAVVELKDNVLTVTTSDAQIKFTATKDNYDILFNTEDLGGKLAIVTENGVTFGKYVDQNAMDFVSGKRYHILSSTYLCDVQGETRIKSNDGFSEFFISLKSSDGRFCDITIESDKIFVDKKSLKR